jgi:hypothetical protein
MYLCVTWQAFTDDAGLRAEIAHAVDLSFGRLQRAKLLAQTIVLRPTTSSEITDLIAHLDGVEQVYGPQFGYILLFHADGERFRCSDPFDVAAARAVTRAVPI